MKNFFKILLAGLIAISPLTASAFATTSVPWIATTTNYIQPNKINGVNPYLNVFSTGTSTFVGGVVSPCFATSTNGACIAGGSGSISAVAPLIYSGGVLSIPVASTTANGYMSASSTVNLYQINSTTIISGGVISTSTSSTFNVATTTARFVDNYTDINSPVSTDVTCPTVSNQSLTNILTQGITYVFMDSACNLYQDFVPPTGSALRNRVLIGAITHPNHTTINTVDNRTITVGAGVAASLADLYQAIGGINTSGNVYSANGANMNINRSAGTLVEGGSNYGTSKQSPNIITSTGQSALTFTYVWQNGTGGVTGSSTSVIYPAAYDNGTGGALKPNGTVNNNQWTLQKIYYSAASNSTVIEFGQVVYNSKAAAEAAKSVGTTRLSAPTLQFRGWLIVSGGTTALNDTANAEFIESDKFGDPTAGGGSTGGGSTMQQTYNNSTQPQITTSVSLGAVQFKRGSTADTDKVVEILNGAGSTTAYFLGNGTASTSALNVSGQTSLATASSTGITVTGDSYFATASGNVGVGTTTPAFKLDLWGSFRVATGTNPLFFANSAAGAIGIGTSTPDDRFEIYGNDSRATFATYNSSNVNTFKITNAGRVGIASTTPNYQFTVATGSAMISENQPATSSTMTIDWSVSNQQLITLGAGTTAISFSNNYPGSTLRLIACNKVTAGALTFTGVRWAGGTAPTQTTTANNCDVYSFITTNGTTSSPTIFGAASTNF